MRRAFAYPLIFLAGSATGAGGYWAVTEEPWKSTGLTSDEVELRLLKEEGVRLRDASCEQRRFPRRIWDCRATKADPGTAPVMFVVTPERGGVRVESERPLK